MLSLLALDRCAETERLVPGPARDLPGLEPAGANSMFAVSGSRIVIRHYITGLYHLGHLVVDSVI